jgi:hypothetical protein
MKGIIELNIFSVVVFNKIKGRVCSTNIFKYKIDFSNAAAYEIAL